jgi:hypothetical protein
MSRQEYREELRECLAQAKQHSRNQMPEVATEIGLTVKQRGSRYYVDPCPFCAKKGKFTMNLKGDQWIFGCFRKTCDGSRPGGTLDLLKRVGNMESREAIRYMLSRAGIEHPYDRFMREKGGQP